MNQIIDNPVILFDGVCNLCSSTVQFVIKHDPKALFRFASLQSPFGQQLLAENKLSTSDLNSFILYQHGKIYTKSTGALMVAKQLNGPWKLLSSFLVLPSFIRDGVYNVISRNRYKWFGQKTSCWLPSKSLQSRFISL